MSGVNHDPWLVRGDESCTDNEGPCTRGNAFSGRAGAHIRHHCRLVCREPASHGSNLSARTRLGMSNQRRHQEGVGGMIAVGLRPLPMQLFSSDWTDTNPTQLLILNTTGRAGRADLDQQTGACWEILPPYPPLISCVFEQAAGCFSVRRQGRADLFPFLAGMCPG
jgi:hypothetical protein